MIFNSKSSCIRGCFVTATEFEGSEFKKVDFELPAKVVNLKLGTMENIHPLWAWVLSYLCMFHIHADDVDIDLSQ